jgi:hypothetical protein
MPDERRERTPQPEREHPIGKALYALNRQYWGLLFLAKAQNSPAEQVAALKSLFLAQLEGVKRQVEAF